MVNEWIKNYQISLPPFISIARGIMGALFRKEEKTEA
jgi:hypothetical protein